MESTKRFTDRVEAYVRYRPSYPGALFDYLSSAGVGPETIAADVGSGTGIITAQLLSLCAKVYAVEPNAAMRRAAEKTLGGVPGFVSVAGTGEATTLEDSSVDLVTVAQAFHWFDREKVRTEFARILRPDGKAAVIWNDRLMDTDFLADYEAALRTYSTDYAKVDHRNITEDDMSVFFTHGYERRDFPNFQEFDFVGVMGRLESSSYAPKRGTSGHAEIEKRLRESFLRNAEDGKVAFRYRTTVYLGKLR